MLTGGEIGANTSTGASAAQARLLVEARAEARLDLLLGEFAGDVEAQRKLVDVFERVTVPLIDRIAPAAEGEP